MGLHVSHGCWSASYHEFRRFRISLAQAVGIDLPHMEGFTPEGEGSTPWESLPPSPLHLLLRHSDCDGSIRYQDAKLLADALEGLLLVNVLEELAPRKHLRIGVGEWDNAIRKWIRGCRKAQQQRRKITFG